MKFGEDGKDRLNLSLITQFKILIKKFSVLCIEFMST